MKHIFFNAGLLVLIAFFAWGDELKEKRIVATVDPDGIQHVDILGGGYYFDPNIIVVKVNVPVELRVKKAGGITPHDIVLKAPDAGINFAEKLSSEPKVIKFTPTKAGKYSFDCANISASGSPRRNRRTGASAPVTRRRSSAAFLSSRNALPALRESSGSRSGPNTTRITIAMVRSSAGLTPNTQGW